MSISSLFTEFMRYSRVGLIRTVVWRVLCNTVATWVEAMFRVKGKVVCQWLVLSIWLLSLVREFCNDVTGLLFYSQSLYMCMLKFMYRYLSVDIGICIIYVCSSKLTGQLWCDAIGCRDLPVSQINLTLGHDFWLHVHVSVVQ